MVLSLFGQEDLPEIIRYSALTVLDEVEFGIA